MPNTVQVHVVPINIIHNYVRSMNPLNSEIQGQGYT